jgi:curved DNA-binding protein CbpA
VGRNVYSLKEVHEAYRRRAREAHPDRPGGSHEAMALVNAAYEAAAAELEFD